MHACSHPLTYMLEIEFRASQKLGKDPSTQFQPQYFYLYFSNFNYIYKILHVCLCTICVQYPLNPEDGIRCSGTGDLHHMGADFGTWVLWKNTCWLISTVFFFLKKIIFLKLNHWKSKNCQIEFFKKRTAIFSLSETWV